jgi:hypothetical protein
MNTAGHECPADPSCVRASSRYATAPTNDCFNVIQGTRAFVENITGLVGLTSGLTGFISDAVGA